MTGKDVLRAFFESGVSDDRERRLTTLRTYLTDNYERERFVKFRQIELQSDLLGLFVDVPAVPNLSAMAQTPHAEILRVDLDALGFVRGAGYTYGEWIDEAEPVGR